mgnify:CR=1 FL=1|tara:strand:- start:400 stop:1110 length:711 start_codon:yes stop_codon:yes gene_type:complete
MSVITSGKIFANGEQLSADKLNQVISGATFNSSDAVDGSTMTLIGGAMAVGTIAAAQIGTDAVETVKIKDANVTLSKIATQADQTVLANVSGGVASPTAVDIVGDSGILIDDDALGTSDTKGATQGNIKAYADGTVSAVTNGYVKLPNGLIMQWGESTDTDIAPGEAFTVSFPITFPTALLQVQGQPNDNVKNTTSGDLASAQRITASSTSAFTAKVGNISGANMNMTYKWNAIGH